MAQSTTARVIVVDDDAPLLEAIRRILLALPRQARASHAVIKQEAKAWTHEWMAPEHLEVHTESSGHAALDWVAAQAQQQRDLPNIAIVDVCMPNGLDGIETCRQLWHLLPDLQIILCTASTDRGWDELTRDLGTSSNLLFLKKPFESPELRQMVLALNAKVELTRRTRALEAQAAQTLA